MEEKKLQLVELIKNSLSLDEAQKKGLVTAAEKLSPEDTDKAIDVLLWEIEKNSALAKEQKRILKVIKDFAKDKESEMKASFSGLLKKIEQRQKDQDLVEIEKSLNQ